MLNNLHHKHTISDQMLITPHELKQQLPLNSKDNQKIIDSRQIVKNIIHGLDHRLLIICGPCSIHDVESAVDYANKLHDLSIDLCDQLYLVMRVYFEKPRTIVGWKGLINDPYMDNSCNIQEGLIIARKLLLQLVSIGVPLATETLDLITPNYLGELFSWSAIGARTTESQVHRELASGLSMPIGFKNSTDGSLNGAINAIRASSVPHSFININQYGQVCLLHTKGNSYGHIILRGGRFPNFYPKDIYECETDLHKAGLPLLLMVDCSHGNSCKDYIKQIQVAYSILDQIKCGNRSIIGLMLESHINAGNQSLQLPTMNLRYGISITDACLDWNNTEKLLRTLYKELKPILLYRSIKKEI